MRHRENSTHLLLILAASFIFLTMAAPAFAANETVLQSFNGKNGANPRAGLIFDTSGNLYGATERGGTGSGTGCTSGCGTVFELVNSGGKWAHKTIHNFTSNGKDGIGPQASLIFDGAGNLYGTTRYGGSNCLQSGGCGSVFQLTPSTDGKWHEKVLYSFCSRASCKDGAKPYASLVLDPSGNLYGTTS